MVTIRRAEYDRLRAAAADLADLQAHDRATTAMQRGEEELSPPHLSTGCCMATIGCGFTVTCVV